MWSSIWNDKFYFVKKKKKKEKEKEFEVEAVW